MCVHTVVSAHVLIVLVRKHTHICTLSCLSGGFHTLVKRKLASLHEQIVDHMRRSTQKKICVLEVIHEQYRWVKVCVCVRVFVCVKESQKDSKRDESAVINFQPRPLGEMLI